jgi:hypothetical protein
MINANLNPLDYVRYLYSRFKYVFRVERHSGGLRHIPDRDRLSLLYDHVMKNGSVDDLLLSNKDSALDELKPLLEKKSADDKRSNPTVLSNIVANNALPNKATFLEIVLWGMKRQLFRLLCCFVFPRQLRHRVRDLLLSREAAP